MKNKLIPKHQTPSQPLVLLPDNTRVESPYVERIPITETNLYKQYLADPYKNSDFNTWKQRQELIQSNKKDEKVKSDKRAPIVKKQESEQGKAIYNQQQRKEQEAKNNKLIWTGIGLGGLALAQATPAAPYIDAAFATHGALGLAKQADEGTLGLNLETGLHALEMLPFGIRGVKYVDNVAREAYAPYDFYRTIQETTPNIKGIPYNVGWGPKQTIKVVHATDSQEPLQLFFDKRWDVTTEGANPFGVWYLGKWGLPRTTATNSLPGKAEKAAKARKLFENRKYKHLGEVTLEKPLTTVGDVPDRSTLSYDAEKMGADGLIYNNVYDNGLDNNLVILSFKTHNRPITIETDALSKITPKGAMVLQQRPPAKISAAERAGIPKGERNQPIAPKYNGKRDVHNSLYKGAAKDNRDIPFTLKDIDGADAYVAKNMRYSNEEAKRDFTNKYEQISERYLGNPDDLDKFNRTLADYVKTLPDPEDMFLNSNGWQSAYVLDYRKYLYNLGYDAADISDYDLAKLISLQYKDLTATMTGKTKGMVMWHGSPKMFDRFDLASTGNYTGNMGYGGPGNYFSNARTRYGYTKENGVLNLQPYLITNVQSTPPMTIMRDKGLIPYYLSPKDYKVEEYKLIVLNLIKKTPVNDNKLYIDDISTLPVGSLDPINGIRAEYLLRRNDGIKSLFPHPSLFVRNTDGSVSVIRNWLDPRVNYKQGGKIIKRNNYAKEINT